MRSYPRAYTIPTTHFVDLLQWRAQAQGDQNAYSFQREIDDETQTVTYAELDQQARAIAATLQDLGLTGERALLLHPPGLSYIAAFFGCLYAGVIAVPAYPPHGNRSLDRLESMVQDAQARYALTTDTRVVELANSFKRSPTLHSLPLLATDTQDLAVAAVYRQPSLRDETIAFLQYTSGSTAMPRGVMVSHANLIHNSGIIQQCFGHSAHSRGLIWLPPYHDMGLIGGILQPLFAGFPVTLMTPAAFMQHPLQWLRAIATTSATTSGGPNFAYDLCVRKATPEALDGLDLSSWEVAFCGAEPIRPETLERFAATFAPCGFRREALLPCYGLAEATLIVSGRTQPTEPLIPAFDETALERNDVSPASNHQGRRLVGCGQPLHPQVRIVHPTLLRPSAEHEVGEIWISSASVAQGYWGRVAETERIFQARLADGDGTLYLRTGDLGFLHGGELFITGRLKDVMIVHGRNIYPQDIELTAEQSHPALMPASCAVFSIDIDGEERMVVSQEVSRHYRTLDLDSIILAIRRAVSAEHEVSVHTVLLIKPGGTPKTTSGKIRRRACREAYGNRSLPIVAESTLEHPNIKQLGDSSIRDRLLALDSADRLVMLQSYLQHYLATVLKAEAAAIDLHSSAVSAGLDSLMLVELRNHLEEALGVAVPVADLLQELSIAELARRIVDEIAPSTTDNAPLGAPQFFKSIGQEPHDVTGSAPLSYDQQRLWLLDQIDPGKDAYHIAASFTLRGPLDPEILERCLNEIVRRHDSLRATVVLTQGEPRQRILPPLPRSLPVVECAGMTDDQQRQVLEQQRNAIVRQPFDLERGPLVRVTLLRFADAHSVLLLAMHHMIADGWSLGVFIRELASLYGAFNTGNRSPLVDAPPRYIDFARWQRSWFGGDTLDRRLAYWEQRLANKPPSIALPVADLPGNPDDRIAGRRLAVLSNPLLDELLVFGRREGVTPFMIMLTAWQITLAHWTSQNDLVIGAAVTSREQPGLERVIGCFLNFLPLRLHTERQLAGRAALAQVKQVLGEALQHDCPFDQIVARINPDRTASRNPLYNVAFVMQNLAFPWDVNLSPELALSCEGTIDGRDALLDLRLLVAEKRCAEGISLECEYNAGLFSADTIERLLASFRTVLSQLIRHPDHDLAALTATLAQPGARSRPDTLCVAATFTAEPVEESLAFWMQELDLAARVEFAPYNQVFQQLVDPTTLLRSNTQGCNVLLVRFEDWQRLSASAPDRADSHALDDQPLVTNVEEFVRAVRTAVAAAAVPYLICFCPPSPAVHSDERQRLLMTGLEELVAGELRGVGGVDVVLSATLARYYPVRDYADPYADELGHVPYTPLCFSALGSMIARRVHALRRSGAYKVIALDCDQVLWRGVCGEDGPDGVGLEATHRMLQEFMVAQHDAGKLLCLCSKNNEEDVFAVFERRSDMPLRRSHFAAYRINWEPKSANLAALAEELGVGLDSFIFLDDSPLECAEIEAAHPQVLSLQLPTDPSAVRTFLEHVWAFDLAAVTWEDARRTQLYHQQKARMQARSTMTFADFLAQLNLEMTIMALEPQHIQRAAQLTQRTNQFNVSTRRWSESELRQALASGNVEGRVIDVSDRFGAYGLVGLIIFTCDHAALVVDTLLLSCRALGRGVEHQMLALLGRLAQERGLDRIEVPFIPTAKNQPALLFLQAIGADAAQNSEGGCCFVFTPEDLAALKFTPRVADEPVSKKSRSTQATGKDRQRWAALNPTLRRIATSLYSPAQILRAAQEHKRQRPGQTGAEIARVIDVLSAQPTVRDLVVRACEVVPGHRRLVAYVAWSDQPTAEPSALVAALTAALAENAAAQGYAARPITILVLDQLPRDAAGQIDEARLPQPDQEQLDRDDDGSMPRMPVEKRLVALWADVLGLDHIGIHDNFFDLGGQSLLAIQLISRIREEFQIDMPPKAFFAVEPTIAMLANTIVEHQIAQTDDGDISAMMQELGSLSDEEIRLLLAQEG